MLRACRLTPGLLTLIDEVLAGFQATIANWRRSFDSPAPKPRPPPLTKRQSLSSLLGAGRCTSGPRDILPSHALPLDPTDELGQEVLADCDLDTPYAWVPVTMLPEGYVMTGCWRATSGGAAPLQIATKRIWASAPSQSCSYTLCRQR